MAKYFDEENWIGGGYVTVNSAVGNLINFYNVRYYGPDGKGPKYDDYYTLAFLSGPPGKMGTSIR